jgi:hypothetical protein
MKTILLIAFFGFLSQFGYGQPCQEVNLLDSRAKRDILKEYITSCRLKNYFIEDKGVVIIVTYQDDAGHVRWYLSALIDDRFLKNPPMHYTEIDNVICLVYPGNSSGMPAMQTTLTSELESCLSEVIGSRVYKYVSGPQYTYTTDENGKKEKWRVKHTNTGNAHNGLIIVFNKDGSYTKEIPA